MDMIWFILLHKSIPTCDLGFLVYSIRKGHLQKGQEEWMNTHINLVGGMAGEEEVTLESLRKKMADFARERDWEPFHSPRNLLLALVGEVGELSEIFQWKGEVPKGLPEWGEEEKQHLGEELSDVLLYLVRLSDMCGVDLGKAALRKLELNALKYPVQPCKGSSSGKKRTHHPTSASNSSTEDPNSGGASEEALKR